MVTLKSQIQDDVKAAMKAGRSEERDALRLLLAALLNAEKAEGQDLTDEGAGLVVAKVVKQTRGSIEEYGKLGQADTVAKLEGELAHYIKYAPAQLDDAAIRAIVVQAVADSGAQGPADMGKVMKLVMPQVQGKADGGAVNRIVKESLSP